MKSTLVVLYQASPPCLPVTCDCLGQGHAGGHSETAVAEEEQRGMKNHARILQKGIQTAPVGWSGLNLHEGIAPQGKKGGKEGRGGKEEDPEPQPGFGRHCPVGFGQGKDGAHDGDRKPPEQQGAWLACPEGRKLVKGSQGIVRVPGHVLQAVVAGGKRVQEYDRSKAKWVSP